MISNKKILHNLYELQLFAKDFIRNCRTKVVLLNGIIGAGKTTFISQMKDELNIIDAISSPTFSIINRYLTKDMKNIYHIDFYRLEEKYELEMAGFYDIISSDDFEFLFIEWSEKFDIKSELDSFTTININVYENGDRVITLSEKLGVL